MFELLIKLAQIQAKEDFVKNAASLQAGEGMLQRGLNILKTPFKNMAGGFKDYRAASAAAGAEKAELAGKIKPHVPHMSEGSVNNLASDAWKQDQAAHIKSHEHLKMDNPAEYGKAVGGLTSSKMKEAKGRMIGGALQVAIPTAIGAKLMGKGRGGNPPT